MSFVYKKILVTGGAQGLGRATVEKFNAAGGIVFAVDKNLKKLEELKCDFSTVTTICTDLTNWDATRAELEKYGPFDHLVNNAGVVRNENFLDTQETSVDFTFGVNFKAVLNVAKIFSKGVIDNKITGASIVNISSIADRKVFPGNMLYSCSKAALTMLTKCLAQELGPHGIRVNCIRPTIMFTDIFEFNPVKSKADVETILLQATAGSAFPRLLETSEAAELILYLCSSKANMITGQDVAIDGGFNL